MNRETRMTHKHPDRRQVLASLLASGLPLAHAQTELSDLARIRASGVLKVAVYKDNAPFSDGPASDIQGLDVAIAAALAKQLGLSSRCCPSMRART
jgi:ABC-type amino acid transport substrate-binding protein